MDKTFGPESCSVVNGEIHEGYVSIGTYLLGDEESALSLQGPIIDGKTLFPKGSI